MEMTKSERTIFEAKKKIIAALDLLMQNPMNDVQGIGEARRTVVNAKNSVGELISPERNSPEPRLDGSSWEIRFG
jgi:hypothetical protein